MALDVGTVRIGVAHSDPAGLLALPTTTIARAHDDDSDLCQIVELVHEKEVVEIIVGLPLSLAGKRTASTEDAENFARRCAEKNICSVRMLDERLTTVSAQGALHSAGRSTKKSRPVIDQVAAVILLQHALDVERASGKPPGSVVELTKDDNRD